MELNSSFSIQTHAIISLPVHSSTALRRAAPPHGVAAIAVLSALIAHTQTIASPARRCSSSLRDNPPPLHPISIDPTLSKLYSPFVLSKAQTLTTPTQILHQNPLPKIGNFPLDLLTQKSVRSPNSKVTVNSNSTPNISLLLRNVSISHLSSQTPLFLLPKFTSHISLSPSILHSTSSPEPKTISLFPPPILTQPVFLLFSRFPFPAFHSTITVSNQQRSMPAPPSQIRHFSLSNSPLPSLRGTASRVAPSHRVAAWFPRRHGQPLLPLLLMLLRCSQRRIAAAARCSAAVCTRCLHRRPPHLLLSPLKSRWLQRRCWYPLTPLSPLSPSPTTAALRKSREQPFRRRLLLLLLLPNPSLFPLPTILGDLHNFGLKGEKICGNINLKTKYFWERIYNYGYVYL